MLKTMSVKRVLIFQPCLPKYRVDLYNRMASSCEVFALLTGRNKELSGLGFDLEKENKRALFRYQYYSKGIFLGHHLISTIYYRTINTFRPNEIWTSEYGVNTLFAILLKPFYRYKILTFCDDSPQMARNYGRLRRILRYIILRHVDRFIVVHGDVESYLTTEYVKYASKICFFPIIQDEVVFSNMLEKSEYLKYQIITKHQLNNKKVILFVGRLEEVKNVEMLIQSFAQLEYERAFLIIVGDGLLKEKLETMAKALNISSRILFTGRLCGEDIYALYNLAHIFVLPSKYEPFGAVVNEALLAGCYCIVSDIAGSTSLINENNGIIFKSDNQFDLLSKLTMACNIVPTEKKKQSLMPKAFNEYCKVFLNQHNVHNTNS